MATLSVLHKVKKSILSELETITAAKLVNLVTMYLHDPSPEPASRQAAQAAEVTQVTQVVTPGPHGLN